MNSKQLDTILEELWTVRSPHAPFNKTAISKLKERIISQAKKEKKIGSNYLYPPLSKKAYFELSTARNRNLITLDEQNKLRGSVVAFFGLSVGSHAALTWVMQSRADAIKIIDPDTIDVSNLNRIRTAVKNIGRLKTEVLKEELNELSLFTNVYTHTRANIVKLDRIFTEPAIDIVVDEVDNFEIKIHLRKLAKKNKIPLLSAADVGDNVILDVERYDLYPQPNLFLGRIPNIENMNFSELSGRKKKKLIIQLVGFEKNSEKLIDSLFAVGGSITTWPQLGATATIAGGIITTAIKKIVLGEKVCSGRYYISLDDILVADFNNNERKKIRSKKIKQIQEMLSKV